MMDPIERTMWITIAHNPLMPRAVKEAFAYEWEKGNKPRAILVLASWQVALCVFFACMTWAVLEVLIS